MKRILNERDGDETERERDRDYERASKRERGRKSSLVGTQGCVYIYMYIQSEISLFIQENPIKYIKCVEA